MFKLGGKSVTLPQLARFALFVAVFALGGGAIGVVMALSMLYVSSKNVFRDRADKHGISQQTSSRLGGPVIGLGAVAFGFVFLAMDENGFLLGHSDFSLYSQGYLLVALLAGGVGFWEDYAERLSPWLRLRLLFLIVGSYFLLIATELPSDVFPNGFLQFLNHPLALGLGMTVCVVGFINAGNIADGANGLLSGIALAVFLVGYLETGDLTLFALLVSTLVFSVFNISTGALFLGDSGAYFLSASMALVCVELFIEGTSSVWFYACLVSYPCVELARVMYIRAARGDSILVADNSHVHNIVFEKLEDLGLSPLLGNTITGLSLATFSSGFTLIVYLTKAIPLDSSAWLWIFVLYVVAHLVLVRTLQSREKSI